MNTVNCKAMRLVVRNQQTSLEYKVEEYCKQADGSYYLVTEEYVIHYFQDGMIKYRRDAQSASLQQMYWQERNRALSAPRCPKAEVDRFALQQGFQLTIKPFLTQ